MSMQHAQTLESQVNPLDNIEDILCNHNWNFNRMTDDELMVHVTGAGCEYRLFFIWQEDMSALQFCCQYDMTVTKPNLETTARALMVINENLWLGHFDVPNETGTPSFRYTCLMRGLNQPENFDHIEDMVELALLQCERFYPVFQVLSQLDNMDDQALALALMETKGES